MRTRLFVGGLLVALLVAGAFVIIKYRNENTSAPLLPIKKLDPWILQTNVPDDGEGKYYGTYIGNGYIAARIGAEGVGKDGPCYMSGLYSREALAALPIWSDFGLYDSKGKRFVLDKKAPYRQTLNMKDGYVETELTLKTDTQKLTGRVTFFVSRKLDKDNLSYAAIRYELSSDHNGQIVAKNNISPDSKDKLSDDWAETSFKANGPSSGIFNGRVFSSELSRIVGASIGAVVSVNDALPVKGVLTVNPDSKLVLTKYVVAGNYVQDHIIGNALDSVLNKGYEALFDESKKLWQDVWKSDIVIDGDPKAQQAINAMQFYLLSSASREHSIPPTGLSSGAWRGHIFWDADIWMFPALVLQYPDLAEGIINYRLRTYSGAKANAIKRGLDGIEYAWESAGTGLETIGKPFSEERHITADVALPNGIAPVKQSNVILYSTADYWVSRATYNKVKDRYEILNVLPPDEDVNNVINNSVYTNAAAKKNIELAIEAAKKAGDNIPPKWKEVADKMYIPFDQKNNRFLEYDGYNGHKTKQADTELLIYPLMYPMSEDVKANTFDFYKAKANPRGPAMTSSIHAIIAAELNRPDEAYQHFMESYKDFLRGPFLLFNEKRSMTYENMCFVTGCGGTLQSVIFGFAGLRIGKGPGGYEEILPGLYIKPCLPPKWKKLELHNIQWQGKAYDLTILPGNKWDLKQR